MIGPSLLHEPHVRAVHLQVAVCFLFDVLPNTCIHKYPVLILHTVIPALFGTLDCGHIIQYFFWGSHYCQWTLGKESGIFYCRLQKEWY